MIGLYWKFYEFKLHKLHKVAKFLDTLDTSEFNIYIWIYSPENHKIDQMEILKDYIKTRNWYFITNSNEDNFLLQKDKKIIEEFTIKTKLKMESREKDNKSVSKKKLYCEENWVNTLQNLI